MLKKLLVLTLISLIAGCAGIPFCNDKGQPQGCRQWDPATKTGAGNRS